MKKIIILTVMIMMVASLAGWDDLELLTAGGNYSQLKPNVMIIMDNSGSMNTIIFPSSYDPGRRYVGPGCDFTDPDTRFYAYKSGNKRYLSDNPESLKYAKYVELTATSHAEVFILNLADCDGMDSYIPNQNIHFYTEAYNGQLIRYPGNLINYLLYYATPSELAVWNHFMIYGKWDTSDFVREDFRKVRIRAATNALKEIIADIYQEYENDPNPNKAYPRIGLTVFENGTNPYGGTLKHDCSTSSNMQAYFSLIDGVAADAWTPLAETYAEVWSYFRHGGSCPITDEKYYYPMDHPSVQTISSNSPITHWCQANFIIVMTDGESTRDIDLRNHGSSSLFYLPNNKATWGDVEENDDDTATLAENGSNYLDDLAYFAYENDIYPDHILSGDSRYEVQFKNKQFIYSYAIGFTIDNQILRDTAKNGGGEYVTAQDYDSLVRAMKDVFSSIDEKVTSFAAFAAPKYSLTHGRRGYVATFIPRADQGLWEGFLKCYDLNPDTGDFEIDINGNILNHVWDASDQLKLRTFTGGGGSFGASAGTGDRTIFTWYNNNRELFVDSNSNITTAMLDISGITPDADRKKTIEVIRGKIDPYGFDHKLGDTFHCKPVVVSPPLKWRAAFDPVYAEYYNTYKNRPEVIFSGANDGMFHCFRVTDGHELWGFIPPSSLKKLKKIGLDNEHTYYVDGQSVARDIYKASDGTASDWATCIYFGQGLGGESYYSLDVTDPTNPAFRWQVGTATYGANSGKTVLRTRTGETLISDSVLFANTMDMVSVGKVKYQDGANLVARSVTVLAGGHDPDENLASVDTRGKTLLMVNAYTGEIIKRFSYKGSGSSSDLLWESPDFLYSMAAAPVLVDLNNDDFYDRIYQADIGGRIWKIDISSTDRETWIPEIIFHTNVAAFTGGRGPQPVFVSPAVGYDTEYNIWVFFGTGPRSEPNDTAGNGIFVGFKDDGNHPAGGYSPSDLQDITTYMKKDKDGTDTDGDGYSDTQENEEGTDPNDKTSYPLSPPWAEDEKITDEDGFYFNFIHDTNPGEKLFDPAPIYINSTIFFNTYVPPTDDKDILLCDPAGDLYVYELHMDITGGSLAISAPDVEKGRILGSGLLSGGQYKVYIGDGEIGSSLVTKQRTVKLDEIFGPFFWNEKKYRIKVYSTAASEK